jgi:hypothetical protein
MWRHLYTAGLAVVVSLGAGSRGFAQGAAAPPADPAGRSDAVAPPAGVAATTLPSDAGQVWRDYDISGYTARVTSTSRPEQAIIDWILRDTGYEIWHSEPVCLLSAGPRTLHVYHTPEMQKRVAELVERFTSSEAAAYTFSTRVVTLDSPVWRTTAARLLRPVPVQTGGVHAWVLPKEDAAILVGELRRRADYRELCSPYQIINNGQATVISSMRGRPYVRDVAANPNTAAGFEPSPGQVDEGFAIDFSPLLSLDRRTIDATIKCDINQVEAVHPVIIEVPTATSPRQRTKIEVPQVSQYRFHERFRWPVDRVLVVGMGMLPLPLPVDGATLVPGVPLPLGNSPARGDLLVMVECHGPLLPANAAGASAPGSLREARNYRGRY